MPFLDTASVYAPAFVQIERAGRVSDREMLPYIPDVQSRDGSAGTSRLVGIQSAELSPYIRADYPISTRSALDQEIENRLREIQLEALRYGESFSADSLADLYTFLNQLSFIRRPSLFLLENGNFRAVWRNSDQEQAGFQFRGAGKVQCVFFERAAGKPGLARETAIYVLADARRKAAAFRRLLDA